MASTSDLSALFKRVYNKTAVDQVNRATLFIEQLVKDTEHIAVAGEGLTCYWPCVYQTEQGIGYRAQGGTLPSARTRKAKQASDSLKFLYGKLTLNGQVIKAAKHGGAVAFGNAINDGMKDLIDGLKIERARNAMGGTDGAITSVGAISAHVITCSPTSDVFRFALNMELDSYEPGVGAGDSGIVVTAIDYANGQITVSGDSATDTSDYLYRAGGRANGITGMDLIYSASATLHGLDLATYPWWLTNVLSGSSVNRALTEELIQEALDYTANVSGTEPDFSLWSKGLLRKYVKLIKKDRRILEKVELPSGQKIQGYTDGNTVIPIITDRFATANEIKFGRFEYLKFLQLGELEWMDFDGSMWDRESTDAYSATSNLYEQFVCMRRNAMTKMNYLTQ